MYSLIFWIFVDLLDLFHAAELEKVTEHEHRHIDSEAGRSVVEAVRVGLRLIGKHRRAIVFLVTDEILTHYNYGKSRGSDVLLRACVNESVFVDVHFLAQNHARHIGYDRAVRHGESTVGVTGAEYGVVLRDMNVVDTVAEFNAFGDIGEYFVFGACRDYAIAVFGRLFGGFSCKVAGHDIVRFAVDEEVERDCRELLARAALYE